MYDLATGQSAQVAQHAEPVKGIRWVDSPDGGYLVTGSWDKTMKVRPPRARQSIVLQFIYWPAFSAVLGSAVCQPYSHRTTTRALLQPRCFLPAPGGWYGRPRSPRFRPAATNSAAAGAPSTAGKKMLLIFCNSQTIESPIKWQTRVVSCFPDGTGYAAGTTGGRTAIR